MPGETQIVEGRVQTQEMRKDYHDDPNPSMCDVEGLQEALEKWVGRKVSIIIEDVTDYD